jgi:hypothetical protein
MFRNVFAKSYAVRHGNAYLIITRDSCFKISEATHSLVSRLPPKGEKKDYLDSIAALGIPDAGGIFRKLVEIKCLVHFDGKERLKNLSKELLNPVIELIPGRFQEKLFPFLRSGQFTPEALFKFSLYASLFGLVLAVALPFWAGFLPHSEGFFGPHEGTAIMFLVALSILVHELGHSSFAYLNGIGFRPIGFSIYLFFPVFYANISGVSQLELKPKLSINLGGLALQSIFMGLLSAIYLFWGLSAISSALQYISYLIIFNMNPMINTDTYWCYQDVMSAYKGNRIAELVRKIYSLLSFLFTIYLLYVAYNLAAGVVFLVAKAAGGFWTAGGVVGALVSCYVLIVLGRGIFSRFTQVFNPREAAA